jgi:hypothetical protein
MNIYVHLLYLAQSVLEGDMTHAKVAEKNRKRLLCPVTFFEKRAVYEVMWKNTVQPDWPHKTIQHIRFSCWITKSTDRNTHRQTKYKIRIVFSKLKMVTRTHLTITLCIHYLYRCMCCRKTFYKIRRNDSIMKPKVWNIMIVCLYSCLSNLPGFSGKKLLNETMSGISL